MSKKMDKKKDTRVMVSFRIERKLANEYRKACAEYGMLMATPLITVCEQTVESIKNRNSVDILPPHLRAISKRASGKR